MSWKILKISKFTDLFLIILTRDCESEKIIRESFPRFREKVMASRTAKTSATKGDETKVAVAACWVIESRSSTTQPNPAFPVEGSQAASVEIVQEVNPGGLGSELISGVASGGGL
ncbi:Uncharacterized protein Rs2_28106 [Raphanus sativus]|nr:Uncharacterized protein Rs2_28106 [Raphanus sativus]